MKRYRHGSFYRQLRHQGDRWSELVDKFLVLTGLEDNQAVAYLHEDTTYPDGTQRPHAHIIVNRVGDDGRAIDTSWDYYRFQTVMRVLEEQFEWQRQPCSWEVEKRRDTPGQVQRLQREREEYERGERSEPPTPAMRSHLADAVERAIDESTTMRGIEQFLKPLGIEVHHHQEKDKLGWSFECDGFHFAGWQLGRNLSQWSVNKKLNLERLELKKQYPITAIQDGEVRVRSYSESELVQTVRTTLEDSRMQVEGEKLLSGLQKLAPDEFDKVSGAIRFNPFEGASYWFEIDRHTDGTIEVLGFDDSSKKDEIFKAYLKDGVISVQNLAMPASHIELLRSDSASTQKVVQADRHENFSGVPTASLIAETLVNYAHSRASFYELDYTEPIEATFGTISVQADEDATVVSISGEDDSTKFAAFEIDGKWVVETDELIKSERKRVQAVPQTPEDYAVQARGKEAIAALQALAPRQFEGDSGDFDYRDYRFEVDRDADGDVQVVGFNESSDEILRASIVDGAMNIHHCAIAPDAIQDLVEAADRAKNRPTQLQLKEELEL